MSAHRGRRCARPPSPAATRARARWVAAQAQDRRGPDAGPRRVHYMSMEFLTGRMLGNALAALGLEGVMQQALAGSGQLSSASSGPTLADVLEHEAEARSRQRRPGPPGGVFSRCVCLRSACRRSATACASEYGMFAQAHRCGGPAGRAPGPLDAGSATRGRSCAPELRYRVGFGGQWSRATAAAAPLGTREEHVFALAYDTIVPGHGTAGACRTLRLWEARAPKTGIDFATFCRGQHLASRASTALPPTWLNWVLYPDDRTEAGRVLRLKQEHLLVSASMQDLLARHLRERGTLVGTSACATRCTSTTRTPRSRRWS